MTHTTPVLVIITGLPCSGKTTLARRLASDLHLPLVTKDGIKEILFETVGWSDREWSRKLGAATYELMYHWIEILLAAGVSLAAESNFPPEIASERLTAIRQTHPFNPVIVECYTTADELRARWQRRAAHNTRHPGHRDADALEDFFEFVRQHTDSEGYAHQGTPALQCPVCRINTSFSKPKGYLAALRVIRETLAGAAKP